MKYFLPLLLPLLFLPSLAFSYEIRSVDTDLRGDFVLSPAKLEFSIAPGESETRSITLTNRQTNPLTFIISVEDFTGSTDPGKALMLLGNEQGPYSLRDFLIPEILSFTLQPKEQISLPVKVVIPHDAEPGGRYGSVIIATRPLQNNGGAVNISRLGALFFVRVKGEAKEEGNLDFFRLKGNKRIFSETSALHFEFLYKNTGNVHVSPYGIIEIKNMAAQSVGTIEIDPYFALPHAVRFREITWSPRFLMGRYTAHISLNRGYDNIIDEKEISFWIIPWKLFILGFIFLVCCISSLYFVGSRFEIRRKR